MPSGGRSRSSILLFVGAAGAGAAIGVFARRLPAELADRVVLLVLSSPEPLCDPSTIECLIGGSLLLWVAEGIALLASYGPTTSAGMALVIVGSVRTGKGRRISYPGLVALLVGSALVVPGLCFVIVLAGALIGGA